MGGAVGQLVRMRWSQGELGRPGENLYQATFVTARPHKLLIELDEQVLAVLAELATWRDSGADRPRGTRRGDLGARWAGV